MQEVQSLFNPYKILDMLILRVNVNDMIHLQGSLEGGSRERRRVLSQRKRDCYSKVILRDTGDKKTRQRDNYLAYKELKPDSSKKSLEINEARWLAKETLGKAETGNNWCLLKNQGHRGKRIYVIQHLKGYSTAGN